MYFEGRAYRGKTIEFYEEYLDNFQEELILEKRDDLKDGGTMHGMGNTSWFVADCCLPGIEEVKTGKVFEGMGKCFLSKSD